MLESTPGNRNSDQYLNQSAWLQDVPAREADVRLRSACHEYAYVVTFRAWCIVTNYKISAMTGLE